MMAPRKGSNYQLIAWTPPRSEVYHVRRNVEFAHPELEVDPEFIHFKDVNGFAVQWHPEMMMYPTPATEYVLDYLKEHVR